VPDNFDIVFHWAFVINTVTITDSICDSSEHVHKTVYILVHLSIYFVCSPIDVIHLPQNFHRLFFKLQGLKRCIHFLHPLDRNVFLLKMLVLVC